MQVSGVLSDGLMVLPTTVGSFRLSELNKFPVTFGFAGGLCKRCFPFSEVKHGNWLHSLRTRNFEVKAMDNTGYNSTPIAPLQLESPIGELLSQILQTHPHLLPAAVDQQLENLQTDRDAQRHQGSSRSTNPLYRRIAEVKEKERQKALEEIIYCLIVQKFVDNQISMIPTIQPASHPSGKIDSWPNQEHKLESLHSAEAFEMIQSHLALVLGERLVSPLETMVQISKLRLGKLYAASTMYGYFLKRVDERFQLERTMKILPKSEEIFSENLVPKSPFWDSESLIQISIDDEEEDAGVLSGPKDTRTDQLRSYVMQLDAETLQRYATIRSKESISLIEKQTQALFGRPDIRVLENGTIDTSNDEIVGVTFTGLTMLVLEAVSFGSFLWEAESYVESKCHFVVN